MKLGKIGFAILFILSIYPLLYAQELLIIAFHEAGHIMAGVLTGYPPDWGNLLTINLAWLPWDSRVQVNFPYGEIPWMVFAGSMVMDIMTCTIATVLLFLIRGRELKKNFLVIYLLAMFCLLASTQVVSDFTPSKPYADMLHIASDVPAWVPLAGTSVGWACMAVTLLIMLYVVSLEYFTVSYGFEEQ